MTQRDRFLRFMSFEPVDRIPLMDLGVWPESLEEWHHQGLPKWVTEFRHLESYLGMDVSWNVNWLPLEQELFPPPERQVLEDDGTNQVISDERGVVFRQQKHYKSIPQYIRFPVRNEADYDALRPRLDGSIPERYPADFDEELRWRRARGEIVGANFRSFFGFPRNMMGAEGFCIATHDQPELVARMIADRLRFAKDLLARVLSTGALDFVQIWEDMAFKTASLVSPAFVREHMLPAYRELVRFLRDGGVTLIMVDCDGFVGELLPIWLEAGIDGCHPCEIAAGSDPLVLRARHPRARLIGGMDKREVARGNEGVDREIERLLPLARRGGFIPMIDHFVPPDVSFETYRYCVERRRELFRL
jgi:hypothetical protein